MTYQLIVCDFDGTLADTGPLALRLYNELAERHSLRPVTDPEAVRHLTTRAFLKQHGISLLKLPALLRDYLIAQRGLIAGVPLFAGLPEVLRRLRREGRRLGIVSSNSAENIAACLEGHGVADVFEFVVGYPRLFGKATALRRLLRRRRLAAADVLYVGDEVRDIEAARKAGLDVAAVTWGFQAPELLARHAPTYLLTHPEALLDVALRPGEGTK